MYPVPRIALFKSSLVYSGTVLWNSLTPCLSYIITQHCNVQITLRAVYYALIGWPCKLVIVTRLQLSAFLCLPVLHAFTYQMMFATEFLKALHNHLHSRLSDIMFDV